MLPVGHIRRSAGLCEGRSVRAVSFVVAADLYDRFMGRYSVPLAPLFADFAGVGEGQRTLDVGCGPGALTAELVRRLGAASVNAVDPSEPFVAAARERHPDVTVQRSVAEHLPFADDEFDASLAQLVVHFMKDPAAGLREMGRVTKSTGVVAACVWDHEGGKGPLSLFWQAAHELDPGIGGEANLAGAREGHLEELFLSAGLHHIEASALSISTPHQTFDEWWQPYTLGVGPAGSYTAGLEPDQLVQLRERCRALLPAPPFVVTALAWAVRGSP
jgi:SAM-dependent methyltransferase